MRLRARLVIGMVLGMVCAALVMAGCGSQGYAPALGTPATATLTSAASGTSTYSARLTPALAIHVKVEYKGQELLTTGAQTPAQLRRGSCFGTYVAPLT
ncbi:MAG: hypothetical protein ACHQ4H_17435, partial [Ktedonobacterales bacterium]